MSDVFFIVGMAATFLTTCDAFRCIVLASKVARAEVLAHVEVVIKLEFASEAAVASVFACRQLISLEL